MNREKELEDACEADVVVMYASVALWRRACLQWERGNRNSRAWGCKGAIIWELSGNFRTSARIE